MTMLPPDGQAIARSDGPQPVSALERILRALSILTCNGTRKAFAY